MSTLTRNWRTACFTLLLGFIISAISMSARADAASDYTTLGCAGCHGTPPGTGTFPIDLSKYPTNSDLATYIEANMPQGNAGLCVGTCAQDMAAYLRPANNVPVANASNSYPLSGSAPLTVTFDGGASTDDSGLIASYVWDFDDGSTGSGVTITHQYINVGTYYPTLTVTDSEGLTDDDTLTVTVSTAQNPPVADASRSSNLSGIAPLTAHLDGSLSTCDGGCAEYQWFIDDGGSGLDGVIIDHTFKVPGPHTVKLEVTDSSGPPPMWDDTTLTIFVTASSSPPVADASKSPNVKGAVPLEAQFDASLSDCDNTCGSYTWDFGDGTSATGTDATTSHSYSAVGTYNVTLTVTDLGNGKQDTDTLQVTVVPAESLTGYVQACRNQLNFQNVNIPDLDCYNGDLFATSSDFNKNGSVNDYMGYRKVTDQVDLAFACRWLFGDKTNRLNPISVEMLLHNRENGNTCFFSAKGFVSGDTNQISSIITSPTSPAAASFWDAPASVDANIRCVGCHISGPYIATPTIAPFLAKYGLLNNRHDTLSNVTTANTNVPVKYHAISGRVNGVPGAFSLWDSLKQSYIDPDQSSCSEGCHMIGTLSPQHDVGQVQRGFTTILTSPVHELLEINHANVMPPDSDGNPYRWINLDTPGDGVETENFADAKNASTTLVPKLLENCDVPSVMEAHVVGTNHEFIVTQPSRFAFLPDRLSVFNLKDGLVCLNSDQEPGDQCEDYRVRYECTAPDGEKTMTDWYNTDSPNSDGDHEERYKHANLCTSPAGSKVTAIEAAVTLSNGWTYSSYGPNDRLESFSPYGLTCNNADQPDGQCSNYVVYYSSCGPAPSAYTARLSNAWSGRLLTATTQQNDAETRAQPANSYWSSQDWAIEPVPNTGYVRLRNMWTGRYLNVQSDNESAKVVNYDLVPEWTSQQWVIETISGSSDVRLRNVWTGRYLTITDTSDYAAVLSQSLNTGWASQRWHVQ